MKNKEKDFLPHTFLPFPNNKTMCGVCHQDKGSDFHINDLNFEPEKREKKPRKKTIVKKQKYTIECIHYSDGTSRMNRTCERFYSWELLGLFDFCRDEVLQQMKGEIKPDIVKRTVIED